MTGKLKVELFPFRWVGVWLFCMFLYVGAYFKHGTVVQWWVIPLFSTVFLGCFYCEYNRSVTWDEKVIRQRWRGAGYFFWHLDDDSIRIEDIVSVTTDRYTNTWRTSKVFMNFEIRTADFIMYINADYFRREGFEEFLKYIVEMRPDVVLDEDVVEFMEGGFLQSFPYKFSTTYRLIKEGKM